MSLANDDLLKMYYYMVLTRINDEKVLQIYYRQGLPELPHSVQGEEAIAVGTGYPLQQGDFVLPSLRARGYFFMRGVATKVMMAGMYGKAAGPARGKSTSHHMGDLQLGILAGSGVVGSSIPLAVGAGLAMKMDNTKNVCLVSFGDGATSRGDFHESMNLAAVWKLPVIFVCENNGWAMGNPLENQVAITNLALKADGYGMPAKTVDGNDVLKVYHAALEAIDRARSGEGPTFLECKTNRWTGHAATDQDTYRDRETVEEYKKNCPVKRFENYLIDNNIADKAQIAKIKEQVLKEVEESIAFAENSPYPEPEEAAANVFAD